jgi:hypothetical protein
MSCISLAFFGQLILVFAAVPVKPLLQTTYAPLRCKTTANFRPVPSRPKGEQCPCLVRPTRHQHQTRRCDPSAEGPGGVAEKGEGLPLYFHFCGPVPSHVNDEQNRLVFKTLTWLKIIYMHGFLILSDFHAFLRHLTNITHLR